MIERLCAWLHRWRFLVVGVFVVHNFLLHYFFIGMPSWDGLTYRIPPIVEVVQHGRFNFDHYNQWAFLAYVPFIELAHTPFVWLLKMPGVLFGYPLVLFPLCIVAVYKLANLISKGDRTCAFFAATAYAALPLVNEGAVAGYVDFAVSATLCYYLYALLRAADANARTGDLLRITIATVLYTLCRGQALYAATIFFGAVGILYFVKRVGLGLSLTRRSWLAKMGGAFAVGAVPSLCLQVWRYREFGSPMYPYQIQLLGRTFGTGMPMKAMFTYAGLPDDSLKSLVNAAIDGWLWPTVWPPVGFYDSRHLGAGFVFWITLAVAWFFVRAKNMRAIALVGLLVLLSVVARDYCHPRWASSLLVAVFLIVGIGMSTLVKSRARWLTIPIASLLFLHAFRPELELTRLKEKGIGPRFNASGSGLFVKGPDGFDAWPDLGARILIVQEKGFVLPVYGTKLTNEVIRTIPGAEIGASCEKVIEIIDAHRDRPVLVSDDLDLTKKCSRECVLPGPWSCHAWRMPARTPPQ